MMFTDSGKKQMRSNKIFEAIKDFETLFPEEFEKCDIKQCGHCTAGFIDHSMVKMCTNCGGMGYVGFTKIKGEFVCRACNGYGCGHCNQSGIVDWITHANGSDIQNYHKPRNYENRRI